VKNKKKTNLTIKVERSFSGNFRLQKWEVIEILRSAGFDGLLVYSFVKSEIFKNYSKIPIERIHDYTALSKRKISRTLKKLDKAALIEIRNKGKKDQRICLTKRISPENEALRKERTIHNLIWQYSKLLKGPGFAIYIVLKFSTSRIKNWEISKFFEQECQCKYSDREISRRINIMKKNGLIYIKYDKGGRIIKILPLGSPPSPETLKEGRFLKRWINKLSYKFKKSYGIKWPLNLDRDIIMAKELLDYLKKNGKKTSDMDRFLDWIFTDKVERLRYGFRRGFLMNLAMEWLILEKQEERYQRKIEKRDWYIDEDGIKRLKPGRKWKGIKR